MAAGLALSVLEEAILIALEAGGPILAYQAVGKAVIAVCAFGSIWAEDVDAVAFDAAGLALAVIAVVDVEVTGVAAAISVEEVVFDAAGAVGR